LRQGRFGAPRDEDQNEEGGPHQRLHRVLHKVEIILGRRYARPIHWNNDAFPAAARPVQSRKGR
jgi:hypothetical protein